MAYLYKREPLTMEESERLINNCKTIEEKLIVIGLLETGMRIQELVSLKSDNFRWQERYITVNGKGGKKRTIPMSDKAYVLFSSYFNLNDTINFCKRTAQRIVKRVANRANITRPVSAHILRHTFAVNCIRKGIPLPVIQKILGHADIKTTMIYENISPEDVKKAFFERW